MELDFLLGVNHPPARQFCSECQKIDIKKYFNESVNTPPGIQHRPTSGAYQLGPLDSIIKKSTACSFCSLVVHTLCRTRNISTPQTLLEGGTGDGLPVQCSIYSFGSGGTHDGWERRIGIYTNSTLPTGKLGLPTSIGSIQGQIMLLGDSTALIKRKPTFHGRLLGPILDFELAKKWITECSELHAQTCGDPRKLRSRMAYDILEPENLVLIDTHLKCLVTRNPGMEYVALSYRWGDAQQLNTTEETKEAFFVPGSLAKEENRERMPKTIQDAITLTEKLGQRYLWVDALCIVQDDPVHKSAQISQMDRVFGGALLTVVAGWGTSANDGLPGVQEGSRTVQQNIAEMDGLKLIIPLPYIYHTVNDCEWNTRGWTWQERLLSRRLMFFTEAQVYYQCNRNIFCEDTIGENIGDTDYFHPCAWTGDPKMIVYSMQVGAGAPYPGHMTNFSEYGRFVNLFSRRKLSSFDDAIPAFSGMIAVLERRFKSKFYHALPEIILHTVLRWCSDDPLTADTRSMVEDRNRVPSWSWASFPSSITIEMPVGWDWLHPEVQWYLIDENSQGRKVKTLPFCSAQFNQKNTTDHLPDITVGNKVPGEAMKDLSDPEPPNWIPKFLLGWTTVCAFRVANSTIMNSQEQKIGEVFLDWKPPTAQYEFMQISRTSSDLSSKLKVQHCVHEHSEGQRIIWTLDIMMFERCTGFVRRLGIGKVSERAWLDAGPQEELIKLG